MFAFFLSADNLILNPGFESWTENTPDNWTHKSGITVFKEDGLSHEGNFSLKDSLTTQSQTDADLISASIEISPGVACTLRVWVYDNEPAGRLRLIACWNTGDSDWGSYSADSANWQQLELVTNTPFNADSGSLALRAYDIDSVWDGDAVFYIDDAEFITITEPPPFVKRIWHTPTHPTQTETENIYAEILDNGNITVDSLYYGINNLDSHFAITHAAISGDTFSYNIPQQTEDDTVFYYLWVKDNDDSVTISDTNTYYVGNKGIIINELCYDTPGSDTACFVELYGPPGASLEGIEVVGVNGSDGEDYQNIDLTGYLIPSDGFFVIAQDSSVINSDTITTKVNLQNGPDNIELRFKGITIDALGYGNGNFIFTGEGLPAPDIAYTNSLSRYPDGEDTDNNISDFIETTLRTPGEGNFSYIKENNAGQPFDISFPSILLGNKGEFIIKAGGKGRVDFSIFNILGQQIFNSKKDFSNPGTYKIEWNIKDVCPGVYFCNLQYEEILLTEKILVIR